MSSQSHDELLPFDSLSAPAADGELLVVPGAGELARMAERNRAARGAVRVELLGEAAESAAGRGPLVVMAGHQPEFFHAGVWIKHVIASRAARGCGGRAVSIVVDSDEAADAELRWPEEHEGTLRVRGLRLGGRGTFDGLALRSEAEWREWFGAVPPRFRDDAARGMGSFVGAFAAGEGDFVSRWERGIAAIDRGVGEETPAFARVSEFEGGAYAELWRRFVGHLLTNARSLAGDYNAALSEYRERRGIRGTRHPIPDLVVEEAGRVEVPLWGLGAGRARERLFARERGGAVELFAGERRIGVCERGAAALEAGWTIRPRALTLTTFLRLFACDVFVHGLGGAKYDQIADGWMRRFFGVGPPAYACATATLRLPLPRRRATVEQLRELRQTIRDRRYNPQRYLIGATGRVAMAIAARAEAIGESERLRATAPGNHSRRRIVYFLIREVNRSLQGQLPAGPGDAEVEAMRAEIAHNRIADDREWFVGLHETRRLAGLCEKLAGPA